MIIYKVEWQYRPWTGHDDDSIHNEYFSTKEEAFKEFKDLQLSEVEEGLRDDIKITLWRYDFPKLSRRIFIECLNDGHPWTYGCGILDHFGYPTKECHAKV